MKLVEHEELVEQLAAEYALGTLRGGARRRFEKAMAEHGAVRRAASEWQDRLAPLAEFAGAVEPAATVWSAIERDTGLAGAAAQHGRRRTAEEIRAEKRAFWRGLRNDLSFWRGLGMVSSTIAVVLFCVLLTRQLQPVAPVASYVAMLADDSARPMIMVTADAGKGKLTVRLVAPQSVAADKSLQLWAIPKQGGPRSLGLLAANGSVTLALPADLTPATVGLLAVSLEPKGGSPNPSGPTGPVVLKGAWVQI